MIASSNAFRRDSIKKRIQARCRNRNYRITLLVFVLLFVTGFAFSYLGLSSLGVTLRVFAYLLAPAILVYGFHSIWKILLGMFALVTISVATANQFAMVKPLEFPNETDPNYYAKAADYLAEIGGNERAIEWNRRKHERN